MPDSVRPLLSQSTEPAPGEWIKGRGMTLISHVGTFSGGSEIVSIVACETAAGLRLFVVNADTGVITVHDPDAGMQEVQQLSLIHI